MTSMDSDITLTRALYSRLACAICLDDIDSNLIVSVDTCGHRFCSKCLKRHIEVMLLDGKLPTCPQYRCKSQLSIDRYGKLLTSKMSSMWKQNSIPLRDRFYCPYKKCSYLMSKTDLSSSSSSSVESGLRRCLKCRGSFCLHCKVPWHNTQSCSDYKKLHPNLKNDVKLKSLANLKGWRQCSMCGYMIERSSGCSLVTCRCGNSFCYVTGRNGYHVNRARVFYGLSVAIMLTLLSCGPNRQEISETVQEPGQDFSSFLFKFL